MKTIPERNMSVMTYKEKKEHIKNWSDFRIEAMKEAEILYGKLDADNLKMIQNYMRKQEKLWKCGIR